MLYKVLPARFVDALVRLPICPFGVVGFVFDQIAGHGQGRSHGFVIYPRPRQILIESSEFWRCCAAVGQIRYRLSHLSQQVWRRDCRQSTETKANQLSEQTAKATKKNLFLLPTVIEVLRNRKIHKFCSRAKGLWICR